MLEDRDHATVDLAGSWFDERAPQETYIVVDATTGSNALAQAREFQQATGLTGVIVTKLDGSGKGGCVIAIQQELGIPTRFIGTSRSRSERRHVWDAIYAGVRAATRAS